MTALHFQKYEGLGNDFIVIDGDEKTVAAERARALCDRHFGIGADGVLLVGPGRTGNAHASMVVINADGSRPEMCGNGLRCVALYLAHRQGVPAIEYTIDTDAGPRTARGECAGDQGVMTVDMGRGELLADYPTNFRDRSFSLSRVSMGNPHAILFDEALDERAMDELGPMISRAIPGGTNVECVTSRGPNAFDVLVWERGVGRTLACGTGAAAVAVALATAGRVPFGTNLELHLPGGPVELRVEPESLQVSLRGPARRVFAGQVPK